MGNKQKQSANSNNEATTEKSNITQIKSNYMIEILISGYLNEIFIELIADKSYESIIKLSIPNNIHEECVSLYGLTRNRYIFQVENLSNNKCSLQYKNQMDNKPKQCIVQNKELLTNSSYKNCKSLYISNIKIKDSYSDIIVLCGAETHHISSVQYSASMITISDYANNIQSIIAADCCVLPWFPYCDAHNCSNLTYDKQYGLMIAVYCGKSAQHKIYQLKLLDECREWKQFMVLDKNIFELEHVYIQMIHKKNRKYLFVSDGNKTTRLYACDVAKWIDVNSNGKYVIHPLAKICYDEVGNRLYFIDISYCCYFDVNQYEWTVIAAPGFWSTSTDVVCIKNHRDTRYLMIIGRNYYFTYNPSEDKWNHRYTLDRDIKNKDHVSYVLV